MVSPYFFKIIIINLVEPIWHAVLEPPGTQEWFFY